MSDQNTIKNPWGPFRIILIGVFALMLMLSMNTPAYPLITAELNIDPSYVAWMSVAYSLGAAVLAPMMGRLSDLIGLKRILVLGLVLSTVGPLLVGGGLNLPMILVGRLIQGLGTASMIPACTAFAGRFFPPAEAPKAYSVFGAVSTGACIFGPTIAGLVCANFGWRPIYLGGAVLLGISTILVAITMPSIAVLSQKSTRFDFVGSITLFISLGSILTLSTVVDQFGATHPSSLILMALFVICMILFLITETRVEAPLIRLSMFKNRGFTVPALLFLIFSGFTTVFMYMSSYYISGGLRLSSAITGYWAMVQFLVSTLFAIVVNKLLAKMNWQKIALIPIVIMSIACAMYGMFRGTDVSMLLLFLGACLIGAASAFNTPLYTASALREVSDDVRGVASGTFRLIGDLGAPIFVAIFVPMLSSIGRTADGHPDFAVSFPKVCLILLIPCLIALILFFFYPKHDPKQDKKEAAK